MSPRHKRLAAIGRIIFGIINVLAGGFFLFLEMKQADSNSLHVSLFVGWIAFGWLTAFPALFIENAKRLLALLPSVKVGVDK